MGDIERRIQFYQMKWIKDKEYMEKDLNFLNSILTAIPIITTIDASFDIFIENYNHEFFRTHGDIRNHSGKSFWKISKIRTTDYPLKFNKTNKTSTSLELEENEGLQEPSHFIIFKGTVLGAEMNFNAPRVATTLYREINKYLEINPNEEVDKIEINPMLRKDAYKKIDRMSEISNVMIKLSTNYAQTLNRDSNQRDYSFGKTFSSAEAAEDLFMGLTFSVGQGGKAKPRRFYGKILSDIKNAFERPEYFDNIKSAKVKGRLMGTDSLEIVDLLEDSLMVQKNVTKLDEVTKAVNIFDTYNKILDSYNDLKSEIEAYSES